MAADLDLFLEPVISGACRVLQIHDRMTDVIVTTDPIVEICAKMAYSQAVSYVNRQLARDTFLEYYLEQDTRIRLRHTPVWEILNVWFVDNTYHGELTDTRMGDPLVFNRDYRLQKRKSLMIVGEDLVGASTISQAFTTGTYPYSRSLGVHILVEYTGGYDVADDDHAINAALIMQTVANYNRKDTLGVTQAMAASGSGSITTGSSPDAGQLVEGAVLILDPYRYFGQAEAA